MRVLEVLARTVSGNERVSALLRRLGFEPFGTRVGDAWMRAAGWEHADWHLTRVRWTSYDPAGS
jgi:RimJ/RimL family protein N-acetyltransferase